MAYEMDRTLSELCDRRDDIRIQLSLAGDMSRPDKRELLNGRAGLIILEAQIVARRRALGRPQITVPAGCNDPASRPAFQA